LGNWKLILPAKKPAVIILKGSVLADTARHRQGSDVSCKVLKMKKE